MLQTGQTPPEKKHKNSETLNFLETDETDKYTVGVLVFGALHLISLCCQSTLIYLAQKCAGKCSDGYLSKIFAGACPVLSLLAFRNKFWW
jgi:hypothetical protein